MTLIDQLPNRSLGYHTHTPYVPSIPPKALLVVTQIKEGESQPVEFFCLGPSARSNDTHEYMF